MKLTISLLFLASSLLAFSQDKNQNDKAEGILKEVSENACKCIDSVNVTNVDPEIISGNVSECIHKQAVGYQTVRQLMDVSLENMKTETDKNVTIEINTNKDSDKYKEYYYDIERYLMANCPAIKETVGQNNKLGAHSLSDDATAMKLYNEGIELTKKDDFKGAIRKYQKAVKLDPNFAFAYDNMGICYRRLDDYDNAIASYQKSLEIDPNGKMPLQNIAIAYQYKKQYTKAIEAYQTLSKVDDQNPEVFYGIGQVYIMYLQDYEPGIDNIAKAYVLYNEQNSPYRSDAEKLLGMAYAEMKKTGSEARFIEILKKNNIEFK